ncbi:MAG TPA: CpsB/CapC family capsule biosynthesis tyrosine phosphatase [Chloroflexota bacterium]|nr:CpsB/CapC family capsule biosynthesis tyrosine phosphatase [Chloroflexota bacterium]
MIDLHTHILPGVDDGAKEIGDAVAMAQVALADGITTIVATPHRNPWAYTAEIADAQRRLDEVRAACDKAGLGVRLILGGEAFVAPDSADQVRDGLALTINQSRYLLLEWPFDQYPAYSDQAVFDLQVRGIVPLMAHAERYRFFQRDVQKLRGLVERGVLVQVTGSSLTGGHGPEPQKLAELLLTSGLAHVLASDAHSADFRPPILSTAFQRAIELVGEARARAMVVDVPQEVIDNRSVDLPPVDPPVSRPFWAFWRHAHHV